MCQTKDLTGGNLEESGGFLIKQSKHNEAEVCCSCFDEIPMAEMLVPMS